MKNQYTNGIRKRNGFDIELRSTSRILNLINKKDVCKELLPTEVFRRGLLFSFFRVKYGVCFLQFQVFFVLLVGVITYILVAFQVVIILN